MAININWTGLGCRNNLCKFINWGLFTSKQFVDEVSGDSGPGALRAVKRGRLSVVLRCVWYTRARCHTHFPRGWKSWWHWEIVKWTGVYDQEASQALTSCSATARLTFVVQGEISWQLPVGFGLFVLLKDICTFNFIFFKRIPSPAVGQQHLVLEKKCLSALVCFDKACCSVFCRSA